MSASIELTMLLDDLRDRGVEIRLEGGNVRWCAPTGAMSLGLIRRVKALDGELKRYLTAMAMTLVPNDAMAVTLARRELDR